MVSFAIKWMLPLHAVALQIDGEADSKVFAKGTYVTEKGDAMCVERSAIAFGVERASRPDFRS